MIVEPVRIFVGEAFKSCDPRVAVKRSPKRIANGFIAAFQSKVALADWVSTLRSASQVDRFDDMELLAVVGENLVGQLQLVPEGVAPQDTLENAREHPVV